MEKGKNALSRGEYADAYNILRPLAEQGNADAQVKVGSMYESGRGVTQDYVQAHMLYNLGVERSSGRDLDLLVSFRDDVEGKMTPEQIAEAQRLAREWKPK